MLKTVIVALVLCIIEILVIFFLAAMLGGIIYLGIDGIRNGYGFLKLTFC